MNELLLGVWTYSRMCAALPEVRCCAPTHFELGRQVGEAMAVTIERAFSADSSLKALLEFCAGPEGRELLSAFEKTNRSSYPHIMEEVEGIDFEVHPKTFVGAPSGKDNFVRSPSGRNNLVRTPSDEERSTVSKEREGHHQVTRVCWQEGAKRSQSVLPEQMHDGATHPGQIAV